MEGRGGSSVARWSEVLRQAWASDRPLGWAVLWLWLDADEG